MLIQESKVESLVQERRRKKNTNFKRIQFLTEDKNEKKEKQTLGVTCSFHSFSYLFPLY